MNYAQFIDTTHEIYDLIDKEVVFEGREIQCLKWLEAQRDYHSYDLREKGSDEQVPAEWWSGGFAVNH